MPFQILSFDESFLHMVRFLTANNNAYDVALRTVYCVITTGLAQACFLSRSSLQVQLTPFHCATLHQAKGRLCHYKP